MGLPEVLAVTFIAYITVVVIVFVAGCHHKLTSDRICKLQQLSTQEEAFKKEEED